MKATKTITFTTEELIMISEDIVTTFESFDNEAMNPGNDISEREVAIEQANVASSILAKIGGAGQ